MGRRGPAPTPSSILKARGSWRGNQNPGEPQPTPSAPDRPAGLTEKAGVVWDQTVAVIAPGVLTRDNGQSLARYCHGVVRWWKIAAWLDANDDTYLLKDRHVRHPNVAAYEKLSRDLIRFEQEFGLTPASRTRIHLAVSESAARAPHQQRPTPARSDGEPVLRIAE